MTYRFFGLFFLSLGLFLGVVYFIPVLFDGGILRQQEPLEQIVGTWNEYVLRQGGNEKTAIRRFGLDDEGSLVQVLQYEIGTQCRIWTDVGTISFKDGILDIGGEFRGPISDGGDSISLRYRSFKGEEYQFLLVRAGDRESIEFMDSLEACLNRPYEYSIPRVTDDGIPCGTLLKSEVDTAIIGALMKRIGRGAGGDLHSILILLRDSLIVEEYFGARGAAHGPFMQEIFRERPHALASCTKSVNSLLIGIARDQGYDIDLKRPFVSFFPEYADEFDTGKKEIEVQHLLTMTAGLEWNELSLRYENMENDVNRMWKSADPLRYLFRKPVVAPPGREFNYNSGASDALGEILRRVTTSPVDEFGRRHLFTPLGIEKFSWSKHPSGMVAASGGLSLRPRDVAKIGMMMLRGGKWKNKRVVSERWISESVSPHIGTGSRSYGFQWWLRNYRVKDLALQSYYAIGYGGNFLTVFPTLDLIVVSTAQDFDRGWAERHFSMVEEYVLPAVLVNRDQR